MAVRCQKITNYYEACEIKIAEMESEYDVAFKCMVDGSKRSDKTKMKLQFRIQHCKPFFDFLTLDEPFYKHLIN